MTIEKVDTLIVGGGQAGLAMSEHLGNAGVPHLVLEQARIAEGKGIRMLTVHGLSLIHI